MTRRSLLDRQDRAVQQLCVRQTERWFGILTEQVVRRGNDESVRALVARIERFAREWSEGATPFVWVKTADQILAKAVRKPQETSGAGH